MKPEEAKRVIKQTFENEFNQEKFTIFLKYLLNEFEEKTFSYQGNYIPEAFRNYVRKFERIGKYNDGKNIIDLLIVYLKSSHSVEKARSAQRNFIGWYLKGSRGGILKDAALVAFVSPERQQWRFSLVKINYVYKNGKIITELSHPQRWSYLVGKGEKSHTAQSMFVPILENDQDNPTLEDLEKAFNIEPVTKKFFNNYRNLLIRTVDELDKIVEKDSKIKNNFESNNINTVDFAKKLLGQIVFLYFLQKKGWFGVERNSEWGTGPKDFLRRLFKKEYGDYNNFFNDVLEPLFYEALNRERDDNFYSRFNCKIPFLNGGLFEPIGGYDWIHTDITLPDELFSNTRITEEGYTGDGILDVFDRFNFTVQEDEPLEKEVAIDPELLGKLYEKFNAIRQENFYEYKKALQSGKKNEEKKFNKKFGVYYTPREIVHYMCQQSLIYYLSSELEDKVTIEDVEKLIKYGEGFTENEANVLQKGKETSRYKFKLPESIRDNAKLIDEKLKNIKICDPAVGSGAFPVGMMLEIVKLRNILSVFINDPQRNTYKFKRDCIENSLYGVDIDGGAVEITKLRLWLSLIVDEEDFKQIKPLPNLDYKIMQGNSLISEFLGINFDIEKENDKKDPFLKDEIDKKLITQFQEKKKEFLNEPDRRKKEELKNEIENLIIQIFEEELKKHKKGYFSELKRIEEKYSEFPEIKQQEKEKLYKKMGLNLEHLEKQLKEYTSGRKTRPFFPWKLYFAEVFQEKGGFDVVIANPPYGAHYEKLVINKLKTSYKFYDRQNNSASFFIELAQNITTNLGVITYIIPKSLSFSEGWRKTRKLITEFNQLCNIIDVSEAFEEVLLEQIIISFKKLKKKCNYSFYTGEGWNKKVIIFGKSDIEKIKKLDIIPIYITEEKEKILKKIEKNSILLSKISKTFRGLPLQKKVSNYGIPILRGKNISKYCVYGNIDKIPNNCLTSSKTNDLFNRKIISQNIVAHVRNPYDRIIIMATLDIHGLLSFDTVMNTILTTNDFSYEYILALLNSTLASWFYYWFVYNRAVRTMHFDSYYMGKLPIKQTSLEMQKPFIDLVNEILSLTQSEDYLKNPQKQAKVKEYERQIDQLVYKLYELTDDEIEIIENLNKEKQK